MQNMTIARVIPTVTEIIFYSFFYTYWPSLEEARNLSIKTDDPEMFNWFATSLVARVIYKFQATLV